MKYPILLCTLALIAYLDLSESRVNAASPTKPQAYVLTSEKQVDLYEKKLIELRTQFERAPKETPKHKFLDAKIKMMQEKVDDARAEVKDLRDTQGQEFQEHKVKLNGILAELKTITRDVREDAE